MALTSAIGGVMLLGAGLVAGGAFVGAQEVMPTPGAEQQTPAPESERAPSDGTTTPKSKEDCERDGAGGGSTSGASSSQGTRSDTSRYF